MDDPVFRTKYQKYKYKVKLWEKEFRKRNGRIPSKHDIRDSPAEVRNSYKMYYKLKTSLLENTLQDALDDDDDFDSSLVSQMESSLSQDCSIGGFSNLDEIRASNVSIGALLTDQIEGKVTEFEAEEFLEQNSKAWGKDVTRKKSVVEQPKEKSPTKPKVRAPTKLLLEASAMVPKRNPRKSLSTSRLSSSSSLSASFVSSTTMSSWKDSLPDLETLLNEKSKQATVEVSPSLTSGGQESQEGKELVNQLDEGWLNRQSGDTAAGTPVRSNSSQGRTFGLRNVNLSAFDSSALGKVDSSSSFGMSSLRVNSFVDEGNQGLELRSKSDSQIEVVTRVTAYDGAIQSDSDGVIENSEDEEAMGGPNGSFNSGRHVAKKRKVFTSVNLKAEASRISEGGEVTRKDVQVPTAAEVPVEGGEVENQDPTKANEPLEDAEPKSKRGRKKAPVKPKAARKARVTKAPAVRRTTRGRKPVQYSQPVGSEEETGDFDPDDEDKDPDFKEGAKDHSVATEPLEQLESPEKAEEANVPEVKSRKKAETKTVRKSRAKRVSPSPSGERKRRSSSSKKSPAAPRIGGNTGKGKKRTTRQTSLKDPSKDEPVKKEDDFDDYVLEFGIESLNNAPRVDIGELMKSTQVVENFIQGVPMKANLKTKKKVAEDVEVETAKAAALRKKAAAGKLNENFVRVDLRKKVFARGKKTLNFSKYKKNLWKKKKAAALCGPEMDMGGCDGGVLTCFQCGGVGHMARSCKVKGEQLLPLAADDDAEHSPFPTLEEAESMAKTQSVAVHANKIEKLPVVSNPLWKLDDAETPSNPELDNEYEDLPEKPESTYIGHAIPQDFLKKSGILEYTIGNKDKIGPLYQLNVDGSLPATPKEVLEALKMFGHQRFRAGQERAVMRVLCGMSTLVTLSTGSGKSLCYQLPAYLYRKYRKCVTLVISPLVSLMEDQVHGVPGFLNAQCLHTNQSPKVRARTMAAIADGELDVLLISPEAVVSGEKSTGFGSLLRQLPPIAFACIDEAHCVSQWSHNFRPSYLMICRVLKEKLGVHTILGLTATATVQTRLSIVEHLAVPDGTGGIISDTPLPDNLILTVSKDANRDAALLHLLQSDRFRELRSIIVYCTRRDECERIAAFLRTCFQDAQRAQESEAANGRKRKRVNYTAEPYHAGLSSARRRTIQNSFMSGELRIVVATIAFGMGINKADIRAIIHYNMPKNFESYVQEVGRAGRDGIESHCHVFLDCHGKDRNELRRHIYANSIDRHVIRKLLQKIFLPCACAKNFKDEKFSEEHRKQIEVLKGINWSEDFDETMEEASGSNTKPVELKRICPGHEACFSVEATVQQLDIPEENIATLLCYLELHEQRYIQVLSKAYVMCKVMSYAGPKVLRNVAKECPPLAMAIALELKKGNAQANTTFIEFPVIDVASAIGWDSGVVKFQLKNLEWTIENNVRKRTPISVSFFDLGFRIRAPGDLTGEELDRTLDSLYERVSSQERAQLVQLQCVSHALSSVAFPTYLPISGNNCPQGPSEKLKTIVRQYFQTNISNEEIELIPELDDTPDSQLLSDIRTLIHRYPENNFSGRAVARIFHGVQSPNYPAVIWGRSNFWRAHTSVDFNRIVRMANAEIVRMRT